MHIIRTIDGGGNRGTRGTMFAQKRGEQMFAPLEDK